jgi:acyl-coenzyme A thioesterase PaaI-like protein
MQEKPFQDYWMHNKCWGCGHNEHGLQIKSYWEGDKSVCIWKPGEYHMSGPTDSLNGGIISSVIDCHAVGSAMANEYKIEGRELDSLPLIWCVTASLKVNYIKPTPIDTAIKLEASILKKEGRKIWISCDMFSNKLKTAKAEVLAIRVNPDDWFKV